MIQIFISKYIQQIILLTNLIKSNNQIDVLNETRIKLYLLKIM